MNHSLKLLFCNVIKNDKNDKIINIIYNSIKM